MQFKVYCVGQEPQADCEALQQALNLRGIPATVEERRTDASGINRELALMLHDEELLGALIHAPYKSTALAYCQELTHAAQMLGSVNVMARRSSGLIYGDNTEVHGFTATMQESGVKRVRTALVLGAGHAARIALAGLREMACARYLVGFRNPRRPAELGSQLRSLRKQLAFFPMKEMEDFFRWAAETGLFEQREPLLKPAKKDDTIKRWDLLVNATPVGMDESDAPLIANGSFMRSFERVLDMVPREEGTPLTKMAEKAGIPAQTGERLLFHAQQQALSIWEKEYKRRALIADGKLDPFEDQPRYTQSRGNGQQGRVPVLRRRSR